MKKALLVVLMFSLMAVPSMAEVTISGYVDVTYYDIQGSGQPNVLPLTPPGAGAVAGTANTQVNPALGAVGTTNGSTDNDNTFDVAEVDLYFTAPLTENITAYAELNSANLGNVVVAEAFVEFMNPVGIDAINLNVGYFPAHFGLGSRYFQPPLRRNISQPMMNSYTVGEVVGIRSFGEITDWMNYTVSWTNSDPAGAASICNTDNGATVAPAATIGNGLGGTANASIGTLRRVGAGLTTDNNTNKNIMGRIGFTPLDMLEIGLSGSTGHYLTQEQDRVMFGVDATFTYNPIRVTFEYLDVTEEIRETTGVTGFCDAEASSWYVEAELDIPLETRMFPNRKTLFLRYEQMTFDGPQTLGTGAGANNVQIQYFKASALTLAFAYDLFDNLTWKAEYQWNDEDQSGPVKAVAARSDMGDVDNDVFAMSLVATN